MRGFLKRLQVNFIDGLIILVPIVLSLYLSWLLFLFVYRIMDFGLIFLPLRYRVLPFARPVIAVLTLVLTLLFIWVCGLGIKTLAGRRLNIFLESVVTSMPLTRSLFRAFKELLGLLFKNPTEEYSDVVLLRFPHSRCYGFGLITGRVPPRLAPTPDEEHYKVFIPGTPNPTIGYLLLVPRRELIFTSLTVERALRIVVSAGILGE